MCAACGVAGHVPAPVPASPTPAERATKFAALRHRDCRFYLVGAMLSMMADNTEHVITYYVLYQTFHSPALAGFAVISHWLPPLFLSVYFGSLADRYDCRKVIQASQMLFMFVSAAWGILFFTNSLQMWHAAVLLVLHGMAGALWSPAEQLMLHDIVGRPELPSAVRLNSTAKSLGVLCGPAVGALLLLLGPAFGIWANVLIYLPLTCWLLSVPYTGHLRDVAGVRRPAMTFGDAFRVLREVADNPTLISMVTIAGVTSFFIGNNVGPQMPEFVADLGFHDADWHYAAMLASSAAGGVFGGLLLESTGVLRPKARTAILSAIVWSLCMLGFAISQSFILSLALLLVAGMTNLATQSISQTLVQLLAPPDKRGRMVGVYNMANSGLRAGSGVTVGFVGGVIGIHWSLGLSAALLTCVVVGLLVYTTRAAARATVTAAPLGPA
jgi:MFS family permease